ncbi:MAG: ribosome small subunit-dependent GTPase A [Candidatus Doudnabacteria bacterium]|nr:ribosome small subunit-dependent GTPase A [Candidatus Doudnabacteria bacterium]
MTLEELGYNEFFESNRKKLGWEVFSVARVTSEHRGAYKVKDTEGEYLAKITGKQMFNAASRQDFPAVGDWVAITKQDEKQAVIQGILPRATIIQRKHGDKNKTGGKDETQIIATNVDVAFIVESVNRDFSLNRFDRYFAIAQAGKVKPAIILNKIDLIPQPELEEKLNQLRLRFPESTIISTSTTSQQGLAELRNHIEKNKTYCFLGSSGVGKSSLINLLLGREVTETKDISSYSDRGKHTTTVRQMYFLPTGIVIDNPGMREVGSADADEGLDDLFEEINILAAQCKYADCTHTHEPDCAILNAIQSGELDKEKYDNYLSLKKEAQFYKKTSYEKKQKDRNFGKYLKKAKKDLKKFGHKDY